MSDFMTTFLCSSYIYCTFYTCHHLEHILLFNINLVSLDGKPDDTPVGGFLRGPYFLDEFQNWTCKLRQWWINDKRPCIFTITLSFLPELIHRYTIRALIWWCDPISDKTQAIIDHATHRSGILKWRSVGHSKCF